MTLPFAHIDGHEIASGTVVIPFGGAWYVSATLTGAAMLSGRVMVTVGDLELSGTVDASATGSRGEQTFIRVVAGAGGWATLVEPQHYHADNGVRALLVAQDAARFAGETLGVVMPAATSLGVDYVRQAGPASRVLEDALGGVAWWVDAAGITQTGTRDDSEVTDEYVLEDFDPGQRVAILTTDAIAAIVPGRTLAAGFDAPQTIRDVTIRISPDSVRLEVWMGAEAATRSRLAELVDALVERTAARRIVGPRRYRVVRMAGERVELQAVRRSAGIPDMLPISMWPGVAGVHATLTPGTEVLVDFIEGDRTQPIVVGFVGSGGPGFAPVRLDFGASPTSFVALAAKADAVLGMIFALLSGAQVMDPTTGLPVPGGLWAPAGSLSDGPALVTAATAIKTASVSTASNIMRST